MYTSAQAKASNFLHYYFSSLISHIILTPLFCVQDGLERRLIMHTKKWYTKVLYTIAPHRDYSFDITYISLMLAERRIEFFFFLFSLFLQFHVPFNEHTTKKGNRAEQKIYMVWALANTGISMSLWGKWTEIWEVETHTQLCTIRY